MKRLFILNALLLLVLPLCIGQVKIDSSEISSDVPALTAFHEVIYPMWHEAYPAKDIQALKNLVPEIKNKMSAVNKATLPGILHEKETDWKNQLAKLNASAENYYKASEQQNQQALLDAAEDLHRNYEMMIRVIRPALQVIDNYHQSLYIIFHKLYPSKDYASIAGLMDGMIQKAEAIVNYPHDDRLKRRLDNDFTEFDAARKNLYDATVALREKLAGTDNTAKDEAVLTMHKAYQRLDGLF